MKSIFSKYLKLGALYILLTVILLNSCKVQKESTKTTTCSTQYPIVLVHGVAFRDDFPVIKYWGKIPKVLKKNGAKVFLANQNAFNSHVENALFLQERIDEILSKTGAQKVNIIAHSKGGIESRYMISKLGMADKVASLTTLATPHWGSYIADTILNIMNKKNWTKPVIKTVKLYAQVLGDKNPDPYNAALNLRLEYMENFNESVPDAQNVYYQSFGGVVAKNHPAWIIRFQEKIIDEKEGANDCTVSVKSYKWGNFRGIVQGDTGHGVSHFDIIGFKLFGKNHFFNAIDFYIEICSDLKLKGF